MPENNLPARVAAHDVEFRDIHRRLDDLETDMYGNGRPGLRDEVKGLVAEAKRAHRAQSRDVKLIAAMAAVLAALISGGVRLVEVFLTHRGG